MQLGFGDGRICPKIGQTATLERLAGEVKWYHLSTPRGERPIRRSVSEGGSAEGVYPRSERTKSLKRPLTRPSPCKRGEEEDTPCSNAIPPPL